MSAPTFSVTLNSQCTIVETLVGGGVGADDTITKDAYNETVVFTGATTPPVSKCTAFAQALSAGVATIDLTALPGLTPFETIDTTGLKAAVLKLSNPITNANKIIASNGASNPYRLDAATTAWSITLAPGQSALLNLDGAADTVGSSHKTIDLAGTASQVLNVVIGMG